MSNFSEQYGPWALVSGAAEGLGAAFAMHIAQQGVHDVLAEVQSDKAQAQATLISDRSGV